MLQEELDFSYDSKVVYAKKFYVKESATGNIVSSPEAVYKEMKEISETDQESLWVITVNTKNKIIAKDLVGLGGIDFASVDPKILFRRILLNNGASFFIVHNHPSGEVEPSNEDKKLTDTLNKLADMLGLRFLDHLIIGDHGYFSFRKEGLI